VAFDLIEYAGTLRDSFYRPGSIEAKDFSETIKLLRYLVLHLAHEFGLTDPSPADPGDDVIRLKGDSHGSPPLCRRNPPSRRPS
jgi:hypothetical protein